MGTPGERGDGWREAWGWWLSHSAFAGTGAGSFGGGAGIGAFKSLCRARYGNLLLAWVEFLD